MTYLRHDLIEVQFDGLYTPKVFIWNRQSHRVEQVANRWRVDVEWWHQRIWREYFKLTTHNGMLVVIYRDLLTQDWYLQRIYD